jgi:hypothetical protein
MRTGIFLAYWPSFFSGERRSLAVLADEVGLASVRISGGRAPTTTPAGPRA